MSSKYTDDGCVLHSKSDNIEIMTYDKADEAKEEFFQTLLSKFEIGLETWMKGSNVIFDHVYSITNVIKNTNHAGSYKDSPNWIKNKKATKNAINDDNQCFQ